MCWHTSLQTSISIRNSTSGLCSVNDKSIAKEVPFHLRHHSKEAERLQSIFTTPYTCTFPGLSLRKTSEHLLLPFVKRNHVSIWNWIQHHKPKIWQKKRTKISQFIIIDKTVIRVGREKKK